jgi:hypothetical protein
MLDLSFARGYISGRHYGLSLLRPASVLRKPRCPYWCPARWIIWRMAFSIGLHDALAL